MASSAPVRRLGALTYDPRTRQYRRADGRFVSRAEQQRILEAEVAAAKTRFRALGEQLRSGAIDLPTFQIQLEQMSKRVILVGASLEKGGFAQLTNSDVGWIGSRVREVLGFVRDFAREIETGKQRLDGRLLARLDQYAQQGRVSQRAMTVRIAKQDGHRERRRVLAAADACRDSRTSTGGLLRRGCIEARRMGWKPIDSDAIPELGRCTCLANCRCTWEYRGGRTA